VKVKGKRGAGRSGSTLEVVPSSVVIAVFQELVEFMNKGKLTFTLDKRIPNEAYFKYPDC
jgi:hypothetical protein